MPVHPDAVADAVGEIPVVRPEAGVHDHGAGRGIHGLAFGAGAGGLESGLLRPSHDVPYLALATGGRGPEHAGARDVARVAVEPSAPVHEHDLAGLERLRPRGAVGKRGVGTEEHQRPARHSEAAVGLRRKA